MPRCDLLDRLVATQRLKRYLGLEIRREPASFRHIRMGGIHLNSLSDFLGPPQTTALRKSLATSQALPDRGNRGMRRNRQEY